MGIFSIEEIRTCFSKVGGTYFDKEPSFVNLLKKSIGNQVEEAELKCKELSENRIEEVQKVEKFISSPAQKGTVS